MPTGGFHNAISRARSASSSDCESWAALPSAVPSVGALLSSAPVIELRVGSRLSSRAAILSALNLGCFLCGIGGRRGGSGSFLATCCLLLPS